MKSFVVVSRFPAALLAASLLSAPASATPSAAPSAAPPVSQEGPSGVWEGAIEVPNQSLGVIVTLRDGGDGTWAGTIDIPAQNLAEFPLSDVAVNDGAVTFRMAGVPGDPAFRGTWDAAGETISGDFEQGGAVFPFRLTRTGDAETVESTGVDPELAAKVVGTWSGRLDAGGQVLRLAFHIQAAADGSLSGTMDSPDQGQTGLGLSSVSFDGTTFRADLTYAGAYFEGNLSADGSEIAGSWNQGGASLPLTVTKQ